MGFGRTEQCMLAVMFACVSYLCLESSDESFMCSMSGATVEEAAASIRNALDEDSAVHSVRTVCKSTGTAANMLLLDLTYPQIPSSELGNSILNNLFNVSEAILWCILNALKCILLIL